MRKLAICLAMLVVATVCGVARPVAARHGMSKPAAAAPAAPEVHLIPEPVSLQKSPGVFRLGPTTKIVLAHDTPEVRRIGEYLQKALEAPTGYKLKIVAGHIDSTAGGVIVLSLVAGKAAGQPEGY